MRGLVNSKCRLQFRKAVFLNSSRSPQTTMLPFVAPLAPLLLALSSATHSAQALPGWFGSDPKINKYYCVQNCTGVANGATSKADYSQTSNMDWKSLAIGFIVSTIALTMMVLFLIYQYQRSTSSRALVQAITKPDAELKALTSDTPNV